MDVQGNRVIGKNAALVILTFLEADCTNSQYLKELHSLTQDINSWDFNCNSVGEDPLDEGHIEADGHLSHNIKDLFDEIEVSVELQRHNAAALQQVAEELREIASQLEHNVVAQATQNLRNNIPDSTSDTWEGYLRREVDAVMRQSVTLKDLPEERVMVALILTLVKGVCEQAPQLLRSLFNTALHYISHGSAR